LDDVDLMVRAALDRVGIAFTFEEQVAPLLAKRRLIRVLEGETGFCRGLCPAQPDSGSSANTPESRR
jgi:hypothetical protein